MFKRPVIRNHFYYSSREVAFTFARIWWWSKNDKGEQKEELSQFPVSNSCGSLDLITGNTLETLNHSVWCEKNVKNHNSRSQQTRRQTRRHADRHADTQTGTQTSRQADRQADTETEQKKSRQTKSKEKTDREQGTRIKPQRRQIIKKKTDVH